MTKLTLTKHLDGEYSFPCAPYGTVYVSRISARRWIARGRAGQLAEAETLTALLAQFAELV